MSELTAEERAEVIRAFKEQHPGVGPGADVDLNIYNQKANALQILQGVASLSQNPCPVRAPWRNMRSPHLSARHFPQEEQSLNNPPERGHLT